MLRWMVVTLGLVAVLLGSVYLGAFATQEHPEDLSNWVTLGPHYATD